jgi:hypothetical protein
MSSHPIKHHRPVRAFDRRHDPKPYRPPLLQRSCILPSPVDPLVTTSGPFTSTHSTNSLCPPMTPHAVWMVPMTCLQVCPCSRTTLLTWMIQHCGITNCRIHRCFIILHGRRCENENDSLLSLRELVSATKTRIAAIIVHSLCSCYPAENLERLQTRIAAIMVQSLLRMFLKREIVSVCPYSNFLSYTFGSSG